MAAGLNLFIRVLKIYSSFSAINAEHVAVHPIHLRLAKIDKRRCDVFRGGQATERIAAKSIVDEYLRVGNLPKRRGIGYARTHRVRGDAELARLERDLPDVRLQRRLCSRDRTVCRKNFLSSLARHCINPPAGEHKIIMDDILRPV